MASVCRRTLDTLFEMESVGFEVMRQTQLRRQFFALRALTEPDDFIGIDVDIKYAPSGQLGHRLRSQRHQLGAAGDVEGDVFAVTAGSEVK